MDLTDPPRPKQSLLTTILRAVLLTPIPFSSGRLIDLVFILVGLFVAMVVCVPVLAATLAIGAVLGFALQAAGAPGIVTAVPALAGLVAGLAIGFLILLRIYMRLPVFIRSWILPDDEPDVGAPAWTVKRDPAADAETLPERVRAADATLAPQESTRADE